MAQMGPARSKTDILRGFRPSAGIEHTKFLKRNTVQIDLADGSRIIRLHDTDIVTFPDRDNRDHFILRTGGWRTPTTKERMGDALPRDVYISQDRGFWYVGFRNGAHRLVPFFEGIEINRGRVVNADESEHNPAQENLIRKQIAAYVKAVGEAWKVRPIEPGPGDCLVCRMQTPLIYPGSRNTGATCIGTHLEEKYVHGSLIYNAFKWAGYNNTQLPFVYGMRTLAMRVVRRYIKAQLGMEAR